MGSEMCIRDSPYLGARHRSLHLTLAPPRAKIRRGIDRVHEGARFWRRSVSSPVLPREPLAPHAIDGRRALLHDHGHRRRIPAARQPAIRPRSRAMRVVAPQQRMYRVGVRATLCVGVRFLSGTTSRSTPFLCMHATRARAVEWMEAPLFAFALFESGNRSRFREWASGLVRWCLAALGGAPVFPASVRTCGCSWGRG